MFSESAVLSAKAFIRDSGFDMHSTDCADFYALKTPQLVVQLFMSFYDKMNVEYFFQESG